MKDDLAIPEELYVDWALQQFSPNQRLIDVEHHAKVMFRQAAGMLRPRMHSSTGTGGVEIQRWALEGLLATIEHIHPGMYGQNIYAARDALAAVDKRTKP